MGKVILGGGYLWKAADGGKAFCEELVKGFRAPVKILVCLFAREEKDWEKLFAEDKEFFANNLPGIKIELRRALTEDFSAQIDWADAIYIRGGETERLKENLLLNSAWQDNLKNKTLAGSSAGANVLAKYFAKLDEPGVGEGLSLVSVKVITHYKSNYNSPNIIWVKEVEKLEDHQEKLPVIKLGEGEFEIIEGEN